MDKMTDDVVDSAASQDDDVLVDLGCASEVTKGGFFGSFDGGHGLQH
jgi:hypothetical protein